MDDGYFERMVHDFHESSPPHGSYWAESIVLMQDEGTSRITQPGNEWEELWQYTDEEQSDCCCCERSADVPEHLMDEDDDWEDMELVEQDNSMAKLEVRDLTRTFRPFYSLEDLEDIDE